MEAGKRGGRELWLGLGVLKICSIRAVVCLVCRKYTHVSFFFMGVKVDFTLILFEVVSQGYKANSYFKE